MAETGADPVPQQALKALNVQLGQQQAERRIRWRFEDVRAEAVVQSLAMALLLRRSLRLGDPLHAHQRALVADGHGEDRHQEQPPLRKADAAPHAAVGQGLEKADQMRCGSWVFMLRNQGVRSGIAERNRMHQDASRAARSLLMSPGARYRDWIALKTGSASLKRAVSPYEMRNRSQVDATSALRTNDLTSQSCRIILTTQGRVRPCECQLRITSCSSTKQGTWARYFTPLKGTRPMSSNNLTSMATTDQVASSAKPKSLDDYCAEISAQLQLPESEVGRVCQILLNGFVNQILISQPFHSKSLHGMPVRLPLEKQKGLSADQQRCLELLEPIDLTSTSQQKSRAGLEPEPKSDSTSKTLNTYVTDISRGVTLSRLEVRSICELFLTGIRNQINAGQPFESPMLNGIPHEVNPQDPSKLTRSMLLVLSPRKAKAINMTQEGIAFCRKLERMSKCNLSERIAVVTLTMFPGGWLDAFISHYLQHSNADIFILASGNGAAWNAYRQERVQVINLPDVQFRNVSKTYMISTFASTLRSCYNYTLICDVDEFIMAYSKSKRTIIPRLDDALFDINHTGLIRTYGLNVVQSTSENTYDANGSVLRQRSLANPVTRMNKVIIMGDYNLIGVGQHTSQVTCKCRPIESSTNPDEAYTFINLHMKHACLDIRNQVSSHFQGVQVEDSRKEYYQTNRKFAYPLPYDCSNTVIADLESPLLNAYIEAFNSGIDRVPRSSGFCAIPNIKTDIFIRFNPLVSA